MTTPGTSTIHHPRYIHQANVLLANFLSLLTFGLLFTGDPSLNNCSADSEFADACLTRADVNPVLEHQVFVGPDHGLLLTLPQPHHRVHTVWISSITYCNTQTSLVKYYKPNIRAKD